MEGERGEGAFSAPPRSRRSATRREAEARRRSGAPQVGILPLPLAVAVPGAPGALGVEAGRFSTAVVSTPSRYPKTPYFDSPHRTNQSFPRPPLLNPTSYEYS